MILGIHFAYLSPRNIQDCKVKFPKRVKKVFAITVTTMFILFGMYSCAVIEHEIRHQTTFPVFHIKYYAQAYHTKYSTWPKNVEQLHSQMTIRYKKAIQVTSEDLKLVLFVDETTCKIEYTLKPFPFRVKETIRERTVPEYRIADYFGDQID